MTYEAHAHGLLEDVDYSAERPFRQWQWPRIRTEAEIWLTLSPPRIELATLALEELRARRSRHAAKLLRLFASVGLEPINWLARARTMVRRSLPRSANRRQRGRLYVILRDGLSIGGPYGAYVGVTSKKVEDRFLEHLSGIRAARGLKDHGIELLYSLFVWANPVPGQKSARCQWETALHNLIADAGVRVFGDVVNGNNGPISVDDLPRDGAT